MNEHHAPSCKLTDQQVLDLRRSARHNGRPRVVEHATRLGVERSTIEKAISGRSYRHLNHQEPPFTAHCAKIAERDKARALRKEGKTYPEIERALGVSRSSISLWCRDVPHHRKPVRIIKVTPEIAREIRAAYSSGLTVAQIKQTVDVSSNRIGAICADLIIARKIAISAETEKKRLEKKAQPKVKRTRNGPQRLTDKVVIELRNEVREKGVKDWSTIAKKYDVNNCTARYAAIGHTFKHLNPVCPPVDTSVLTNAIGAGRPRTARGNEQEKNRQEYLSQAVLLRRNEPSKWGYRELAAWLSEKTGKKYHAGPVALALMNRDPTLKDLDHLRPPPKEKVKQPYVSRKLSPEQLKEKARKIREERLRQKNEKQQEESLRIMIENEDRFERGMNALSPEETTMFLRSIAKEKR